jgi:hypothetical protein
MRVITAKFASRCTETGQYIRAGEVCLFNPATKKTWSMSSKKFNLFTISKKKNHEPSKKH